MRVRARRGAFGVCVMSALCQKQTFGFSERQLSKLRQYAPLCAHLNRAGRATK
jgi:hypothetical protein